MFKSPCRARDWKLFFVPTQFGKGAFTGFGVQVLDYTEKPKEAIRRPPEFLVQRSANTALGQGLYLVVIVKYSKK